MEANNAEQMSMKTISDIIHSISTDRIRIVYVDQYLCGYSIKDNEQMEKPRK